MIITSLLAIAVAAGNPASGPLADAPLQNEQVAKPARADDAVLKVYDARDLNVTLPAAAGGPAASETVMMRLTTALRMTMTPLAEGLFAATGTEEQHGALQRLVDDLRAVQGQAYEVDLSLYTVATESAPAIGSPAKPGPEAVRSRRAVRGGMRATIEAHRDTMYLSDWSPVVSDQSLGFDPETAEAKDGVMIELTLGTRARDGATSLLVSGEIVKSDMRAQSLLMLGTEQPLTLELPKTERRELGADTRIKLGDAVVIAVVPGFEGGQSLVLSAGVRELKQP